MSIVGSGDPASDAVDETFAKCKHTISTILVSLRCPTCDKESKITSQLGLMLHLLAQEPDAQGVAKDLRQFLLRARVGKETTDQT